MTLLACSGCYTGDGGTASAYLVATAVMALPPLALLGGLVGVLRYGVRDDQADQTPTIADRAANPNH